MAVPPPPGTEHVLLWLAQTAGAMARSETVRAGLGAWLKRWLGASSRVGILGMPGVGKTVLLDALKDKMGSDYRAPPASRGPERHTVRSLRRRVALTVLPGQDSPQRADAEDKLFKGWRAADGIVYVTSFGYTSIREASARQQRIRDGQDTIELFRQAELRAELADLERQCVRLHSCMLRNNRPTWMIVAVAKVDLFTDRSREAEAYYSPHSDSPFAERLRDLQGRIGRDRFDWTAIPVAAHPQRFEWNGHAVTPAFGTDDRNQFVKTFRDAINVRADK